jgi:UDP-arabinose 4-epimerase
MVTGMAFAAGGAGYIGSHTCKALRRAGVAPVLYDNLSTGNAWAMRWGESVPGDLADGEALRAALRSCVWDTVLHFAASAYVEKSMRDPGKYFRTNVVNTLNLLEAMVAVGVRRIVSSSSCATYGIPADFPIAEDTPQRPVNPYGESKLACERLIRWFSEAHGLEWVILRVLQRCGSGSGRRLGRVP